jgi:hypothetical protein
VGDATVDAVVVERRSPASAEDVRRPDAHRLFSISVLISAVRCLLAYVILPWGLPAVGVAGGVGAGLGLVVGVTALLANGFSIRRFWRADHRWKWPITVLNGSLIGLVSVLIVEDAAELLG